MEQFKGLTSKEVENKKSLGLQNKAIDSYSPSYIKIIWRNIFNFINIVLFSLIGALLYFEQYVDVTVFGIMIFVSAIINTIDEIRVKKRLEKLKDEFRTKVTVIRNGKEEIIPVEEVVEGDYLKATEGESIVADGEVVYSKFLQIDESVLTGESEYLDKKEGDNVVSGSFIVTGDCVYVAKQVGGSSFMHQVGQQSTQYTETKSTLEKNGYFYITFFVIFALLISLLHFVVVGPDNTSAQNVLSITTIVTLIVPQTLYVVFTISFVISITKLAQQGVLIQKRGSIDDLSQIDVICLDKTGTITTNKMDIVDVKYFNLQKEDIAKPYSAVKNDIVGKNKTYDALVNYFYQDRNSKVEQFDQIAFTSKSKYSAIEGILDNQEFTIVFGANTSVEKFIKKDLISKIKDEVIRIEEQGQRVLIALKFDKRVLNKLKQEEFIDIETEQVALITIQETLNPGIKEIIKQLLDQNIDIKIITGDSYRSVTKIVSGIGLKNTKSVDMSASTESIYELVNENVAIFARSKPEDKVDIVRALQQKGKKVAMIGDGINDVVALKKSDVGIAMETGSKITREVSDITLLKNDYTKIPMIFFEGRNNIFNIKLVTKIFFAKAIMAAIIAFAATFNDKLMPIFPTATIIFSFIGTSFPAYILSFSRSNISDKTDFNKDVLVSSVPIGLLMGFFVIFPYIKEMNLDAKTLSTYLVMLILSIDLIYTFHLIYLANKVRNLLMIGTAVFFGMAFGAFQTILPLRYIENPLDKAFIFFIIVWGAMLISFVIFRTAGQSKFGRFFAFLFPIGFIPLAVYFPTRDYYSATPIDISYYANIFLLSILFTGLMIFIDFVSKSFAKKVMKWEGF